MRRSAIHSFSAAAIVALLMSCGSEHDSRSTSDDAALSAHGACSGHGTLSMVDGVVACTCDVGYSRQGRFSCVDENPTVFDNPIIRTDRDGATIHTADPAAMVYEGTVYLYTGHDEQVPGVRGYVMNDWRVFTSKDMLTWTEARTPAGDPPLAWSAFSWATNDAWAGQVVHRRDEQGDPKFYWYVPMFTKAGGRGIGVAVSDSPIGPFVDARGRELIANLQTDTGLEFDDIDPTVFVDDDGQAYMYWGNTHLKYVKLQRDMIHVEGEIVTDGVIDSSKVSISTSYVVGFTEAPWLYKRNGIYYMAYATGWPERLAYSTSSSPAGPWTFGGIIQDYVANSNTTHPAIIDFNGATYMFYHNGALPDGGSFRRSVCVDRIHYGPDGSIDRAPQTLKTPRAGKRWQSYNFPLFYARPSPAEANAIRFFYWDDYIYPFDETLWAEVPGLADGRGDYVSFRNVATGEYVYDGNDPDHTVRLGLLPTDATLDDFEKAATFKKVPGLVDETWSSYQSYVDPDRYIRHFSWVLYVQANAGLEDATFKFRD